MKTRLIGAIVAIVLAAIGTIVLVTYVRAADVRAADGAEFVTAYVVKTEIPAGTSAEGIQDYLTTTEIPALAAVPGRVTDLGDLEGLQTDVALMPGEQLITARWIDPSDIAAGGEAPLPDGMQAVTIALPIERVVGGSVQAGDTVGVIISSEGSAGDGTTVLMTKQTLHKVLVLSVQGGTTLVQGEEDDAASEDPVNTLMVTIALTTPNIEVLVWGQQWGTVWLTREPESANESDGRAVTGSVVFP